MMHALSVSNLKKTYKGGTEAVKGISFNVDKGDFFALLGPNGAGKSTTINIISSLTNKSDGNISLFGKDLYKETETAKRYIGLVPQEFNFSIFEKVIDIIVQQAGYYGMPRKKAIKRAEMLLKKLGLWEKKNTISKELSGGMKRKLMIVRALIHDPPLLILDEPTAGVDVETRREMWKFIKDMNKEGTTIILTTHYLEEAEQLCKNIAIIDKGNIIENTSMKKLLSRVTNEIFILDIEKTKKKIKPCKGCPIEKVDDTTLRVEVDKKKDLNRVIKHIDKHGIKILSMRNETNRLEKLFIELTEK